MPSLPVNMLLDGIGMTRAVAYRTFVERQWRPIQPMFNILRVKPGTEERFESFLKESLHISIRLNTPISIGPYKSTETRTYVYVTHYGSTPDFMGVMMGLTFSGVVFKRVGPTQHADWTYCHPTSPPMDQEPDQLVMVGVQGDRAPVFNFMNQHGIGPVATVEGIKNVRGKALGHYLFYLDTPEVNKRLDELLENGADFNRLSLTKLNKNH